MLMYIPRHFKRLTLERYLPFLLTYNMCIQRYKHTNRHTQALCFHLSIYTQISLGKNIYLYLYQPILYRYYVNEIQTLIDIWITNIRVIYCYYILSISQLKTRILLPFVGFLIFVAKKEIFWNESDKTNFFLDLPSCLCKSVFCPLYKRNKWFFPDIEIEG